jgi:hypothetical protein
MRGSRGFPHGIGGAFRKVEAASRRFSRGRIPRWSAWSPRAVRHRKRKGRGQRPRLHRDKPPATADGASNRDAQKAFSPATLRSRGQIGGGRSPHALSLGIRWALSLSRAVCSPTLLFAACEVFDLIAGSLLPFPIGVYRVRPLRPVRTPPAGDGHAGRGADTPALLCSRRHLYREDGTSFWLAVGPALRV